MDPVAIINIVVTLIAALFFSGIEAAFLNSNKLQIELEDKQGAWSGKIMSLFIERQQWFIATTRIGSTLSLVCFGYYAASSIMPLLTESIPEAAWLALPLAVVIASLLLLCLFVVFSASIFASVANFSLKVLAIPFALAFVLLFPLTVCFVSFSKFFLSKKLHIEPADAQHLHVPTDINSYLEGLQTVKPQEGDIALDKKIFHNALEFKSVRVRECMIPRTEIMGVESSESIETLRNAFVESGHSKIIIYQETLDEIIGYCHSSALFKKPQSIAEILTPIVVVPETTLANELMIRFINQRKSLAVVVDEFGGTSGIVSMEDVIEEIFGEIEDEHDEDELTEQKLDDNTYLLSARLEIDYLNETYSWALPIGEYETLSGLLLQYTENLPQPGETFVIGNYTITVQTTMDNRIDTVRLIVTPEA